MKFGRRMPDVFIGRVILNPSQLKQKTNNNRNKGTENQNLSDPMNVNVQIVVKKYNAPNMLEDKYLKFLVFQCTSRATFDRIKRTPMDFLKRIDATRRGESHQNTSLDFQLLDGQVKSIKVISFDPRTANANKDVDNNSKHFTNYYYYLDYIVDKENPGFLSYFAVPFFDTHAINSEKPSFMRYRAKPAKAGDQQLRPRPTVLRFGKVVSDVIIHKGKTRDFANSLSYIRGGSTYKGPIVHARNGLYFSGTNLGSNSAPLFTTKKTNTKIIDLRVLKKIELENITIQKNKNLVKKPPTFPIFSDNNTEIHTEKCYISDGEDTPLYTKTNGGGMTFVFHVDIESILRDHSNFSSLLSNPLHTQAFIKSSSIQSIKIFRKRVGSAFNKTQAKHTDDLFFRDYDAENEKLIVQSTDKSFANRKKMIRARVNVDEQKKDLLIGSIRELSINHQIMDINGKLKKDDLRHNTIRTFEVHDAEFSDLSSGKYKYRVEIELRDSAKGIMQAMIAAMSTKRQNFVRFLNMIENNRGFYDPASKRFTKKFRKFYSKNYKVISQGSNASQILPPNEDIVKTYFKALSFFFKEDILTNQTIRAAMLMTSHKYGNLDMCKTFLKMYESLLGRLLNMVKFVGFDKTIESQTFDSQETPSIIKIEETLTNCVSAHDTPKIGLIYLVDFEQQNATTEIPTITDDNLSSHFLAQRKKYFNQAVGGLRSSFGVGFLTPRTMFAPDGEVHDFVRGGVRKKDYIPKVLKYNMDKKTNSIGQPVISEYGLDSKEKNMYALLKEDVLGLGESVSVQHFIKDPKDTTKDLYKTNVKNKNVERSVSSNRFLGNISKGGLTSSVDLNEFIEDSVKNTELIQDTQTITDYDNVLNHLMSLTSNNKKTFATYDIATIGGASQDNPMATSIAPRNEVKKLWSADDPADSLKEVLVLIGFQNDSAGRAIVNRPIFRNIAASKLHTFGLGNYLCKLKDPNTNVDMSNYNMTNLPAIGEMFMMSQRSSNGPERTGQTLLKKIDTLDDRFGLVRRSLTLSIAEVEYLSTVTNQVQVYSNSTISTAMGINSRTLKPPSSIAGRADSGRRSFYTTIGGAQGTSGATTGGGTATGGGGTTGGGGMGGGTGGGD